MGFAADRLLEVVAGVGDAIHNPQMGMGMDRLGRRGGPEKLGDLLMAVFFCLLGKGKIFAVGLGFPGKSLLQPLLRLASLEYRHVLSPLSA